MARVTITNTLTSRYLVPAPIRSSLGSQESKTFDGISITDMESSVPFVKAIEDGTITVAVLSDPGVPDAVEVGNQIAESHLNTLKMPTEVDIYVDGVSGRSIGTGTERDPVKTIADAYDLVPKVVEKTVRIHLGPHEGEGYEIPTMRKRLEANLWLIGTEKTELLAPTAAVSGSGASVTTAGGMTIDEYRGKTIEILTGISAGDLRMIQSNTATSITVSKIWSGDDVEVGDTFRVFEPAVILRGTDGRRINIAESFGPVAPVHHSAIIPTVGLLLENLILDFRFTVFAEGGTIYLYGCEFPTGNSHLFGGSIALYAGYTQSVFNPEVSAAELDRGVPNNESWMGWGLFGKFSPYAVATSLYWVSDERVSFSGGTHSLLGGSIRNNADDKAVISASSVSNPSALYTRPVDTNLRVEGADCIGLEAGRNAHIHAGSNQIALTGTSTGVSAKEGGTLDLESVSISSTTGIAAKTGGVVIFDNSTSHNATGNDIEVGNTPTTSTAEAIPADGDFVVGTPSDGSKVQRVL